MEIKAVVLQTLEGHLRSILGLQIDIILFCGHPSVLVEAGLMFGLSR